MPCERACVFAAVQVAPIRRIRPRQSIDCMGARLAAPPSRSHATASWHRSHIGMSLLCAPNGIAEFGIFRMVSARPEMCRRDSSFGRPLPAHSRRLVSLQAVDLLVLCAYDVGAKRRRLPEPRRETA